MAPQLLSYILQYALFDTHGTHTHTHIIMKQPGCEILMSLTLYTLSVYFMLITKSTDNFSLYKEVNLNPVLATFFQYETLLLDLFFRLCKQAQKQQCTINFCNENVRTNEQLICNIQSILSIHIGGVKSSQNPITSCIPCLII